MLPHPAPVHRRAAEQNENRFPGGGDRAVWPDLVIAAAEHPRLDTGPCRDALRQTCIFALRRAEERCAMDLITLTPQGG